MNGGEMNYNSTAGNGGAIWGGNRATYVFNGGEVAYNTSVTGGGAIWTGESEQYYVSGNATFHDNHSEDLGGAIRICQKSSFTMTGGSFYNNTVGAESQAIYTYNTATAITGGSMKDDIFVTGNSSLTVGAADIEGVINYSYKTVTLKKDFGSFRFKVSDSNVAFKPDADYTYTAGDEAKLICMNEGYATYWDAATGTFRLQAN